MTRSAGAGPRWVDVGPDRLDGFLQRFAARHGPVHVAVTPEVVTVRGADGSVASCEVPFPPLHAEADDDYGGFVAHARTERRVGVLLVRRGGYAVGVFVGSRLVGSKVGSRHVQGRTAAGGWSQQRFARRREQQARAAWEAAADTAVAVLVPALPTLDAVVTGGDRGACDAVLGDPRLRPLHPLLVARRLDVPEPRLRVLSATPAAFRAVRVQVVDTTTGANAAVGS